jgi:hypothetical protein
MVQKWAALTDGGRCFGVQGHRLPISGVEWLDMTSPPSTRVCSQPEAGDMTRLRNSLTLAAALAILCLPMSAAADTTVKAKLAEQNGSGASGTATLTATDDGGLKVVIHSKGLVPGVFHPQHIHGSAHGEHFTCPTLKEADKDGDGVITNEEGMGEYGLIFFPLTTSGGATATPQDALDPKRMPVADAEGRIDYERTFPAEMLPDGLLKHLSSMHVVQHGIDKNNNGKYDMDALGESTFAKNQGKPGVPEEVTDPALCGVVKGAGAADKAKGGVETGGAPAPELNAPLAAAGAALLLVAAAFAVSAAAGSRRDHGGR